MKKLVLLTMLALVLTACSAGQPAEKVTVTVSEFMFEPVSITVKAGQPVELTLQNNGAVEHDFVVKEIDVKDVVSGGDMGSHHMSGDAHSEFDLHISTPAGESAVLTFTATQPGTYTIVCSVPGHEEAGMIGELIVVE